MDIKDMIKAHKEKFDDLNNQLSIKKGELSVLMSDLNKAKSDKTAFEDEIDFLNNVIYVFTSSSMIARNNAKVHFEKIVTDALQFVTKSSDYKFIIQDKGTTKPSYEFYIETTVNGEKSLQKPEEANGGGFIDIISTTLKFAYLQIFNSPKIMNCTILLDEPGKMISEQMSVKFAEYIKFLGNYFEVDIIMITHNQSLMATGDKVMQVDKKTDGYSTVTDVSLTMADDVLKDMLADKLQKLGL